MENIDGLLTGILIAALVVIFAALVGVVLVRRWLDQAAAALEDHARQIPALERRLRQVEQAGQSFSPDQPAPYGERAAALQAQMAAFREELSTLRAQIPPAQNLTAPDSDSPRDQLLGWLRLPQRAWAQRRAALRLQTDLAACQRQLEEAAQSAQGLRDIPWEIALRARDFIEELSAARNTLGALKRAHARGQEFDVANADLAELEGDADRLPAALLGGEKAEVLAEVQLSQAAELHALLQPASAALNSLRARAAGWLTWLEKAQTDLGALQDTLARLDEQLDTLPPGLRLDAPDGLMERANLARSAAVDLENSLARPDVAALNVVGRGAGQMLRVAGDLRARCQRAVDLLRQFEALRPEILTSLQAAGAAMRAAESISPIQWDHSAAKLAQLEQDLQALGQPGQPRTPEALEQDLPRAQSVHAQAAQLRGQTTQALEARRALASMETRLASDETAGWIKSALNTAAQASAYDPANFSRQDNLPNLPSELKSLQERIARLRADLKESELAARLEDAQWILEQRQQLKARGDSVRQRYEDLRRLEAETRDQARSARAALGRIALLGGTNSFLNTLVAAETQRLTAELDTLLADLETPAADPLEKKAARAAALCKRAAESAADWLKRLDNEIQNHVMRIANQLDQLDLIAPLNDQPVVDAQRLVTRETQAIDPAHTPPPPATAAEAAARLKDRSDEWQICEAVAAALEHTAGPIIPAFQALESACDEAEGKFEQLNMRFPPRGWPPTTQGLAQERALFQQAAGQMDALRDQERESRWLIYEMGQLRSRYQELSARLDQAAERAARDQNQVQALEGQLENLLDRWRAQAAALGEESPAPAAVEELARWSYGRLENVQGQWQRGAITFQQVVSTLQGVLERVRTSTIAVDDERIMDLRGETHARGRTF